MRPIISLLVPFIFLSIQTSAQDLFVCPATAEMIDLYRTDANRLALEKFYRRQLPEKDTILIGELHRDTVLFALIAVHNAVDIPERDTVVGLGIHTKPVYDLHIVHFNASISHPFMQALENDEYPTGHSVIDSLMAVYSLTKSWWLAAIPSAPYVGLTSPIDLNAWALAQTFASIPEVINGSLNTYLGDGHFIKDSIHADHIELTYSHGWGVCPTGCTFRRHWVFKVFWDCSVEFIESYGSTLNVLLNIAGDDLHSVSIGPNPFQNSIYISESLDNTTYEIWDNSGRLLRSGTLNSNQLDLEDLPQGHLIMNLRKDSRVYRTRLIKL